MRHWHGLVGTTATNDDVPIPSGYRVLLRGTPLDASDEAAVYARLADEGWAVEQLRTALACGIVPGRGQLWAPDTSVCVTALAMTSAAPLQRWLRIETSVPRATLAQRLLQVFAGDRLVEATIAEEES